MYLFILTLGRAAHDHGDFLQYNVDNAAGHVNMTEREKRKVMNKSYNKRFLLK